MKRTLLILPLLITSCFEPTKITKTETTTDTLELFEPIEIQTEIRFRYMLYSDSLMNTPIPFHDGTYPKTAMVYDGYTNPFQYLLEDIPTTAWVLRMDSKLLIGEECSMNTTTLSCPDDTSAIPWDSILFKNE